jgi:hypothetical protein
LELLKGYETLLSEKRDLKNRIMSAASSMVQDSKDPEDKIQNLRNTFFSLLFRQVKRVLPIWLKKLLLNGISKLKKFFV